MKDIDQIRRENMLALEAEGGGTSAAANAAGMSQSQWSNLRAGAADSKTGKPRGMRKETARKIEAAFQKPAGWLDVDHRSAHPSAMEASFREYSVQESRPISAWSHASISKQQVPPPRPMPQLQTPQREVVEAPFRSREQERIGEILALLQTTSIEGLAVVLDTAERMAEKYPLTKKTPKSSQ